MIRQFFGIISKHDDDIFQTSQIRNGARGVQKLKHLIKTICPHVLLHSSIFTSSSTHHGEDA
jgi:hypothetical protein